MTASHEAALRSSPYLEGMRAISVADCWESDDDLIQLAGELRGLFGVGAVRFRVLGVERINDDHAWVTGWLEVHNAKIATVPPYLVAFEDGEWRDAQCRVANSPDLERPSEIEHDWGV